jgi:hypothetical protein
MLSAAFCDQIAYDPFAQYHNSLLHKHLVFVIVWLTLSVTLSPKEITLSGFHPTQEI